MLTFPNISPELLSFSMFGITFALRWYALAYIAGFILALYIMKSCLKREYLWIENRSPMSLEKADTFLTYLILGVIVGGRLGYVVFYNLDFYIQSPTHILRVWDGGMSFHGGFFGVVLAVYLFCKINQIPIWQGADLIALSTPPGLFLGRVANFINNELWGKPTNLPWGVVFPGKAAQDCGIVPENACARHPTQLYEAFLEGALLFLILIFMVFVFKAFKKPGYVTGLFMLGYGMSRFFIEYFRVPDAQFFSEQNPYGYAYQIGSFGTTMGQFLSIPLLFFGIILILRAITSKLEVQTENK